MLEIKNLKASVSETEEKILDGLNLTINKGETHAIMGPNGGGKSTLVNVIAGKDSYTVDSGKIGYFNEDLIEMEVDERAKKGIFMAFQYPSEIPGVRPWQFIKASVDAKRKFLGDKELSVREFSKLYDENIKIVGMNEDLMKRSLNEGFSGGEKKRNEVFQMLMLEPQLALLDETDSGLDVDALKSVGDVVNRMRNGDRSFLIVTHYQRLLDHIKPDFVHVLIKGKIVESGGYELVKKIEENGYESFV
ncbi:MAG: Fe-S cluster assembly ATPase SufC [Chloroflexota bacterium]|nr:Fe-S cluster assembly ATPase SufC [Chloroflexota bacterium]MEC8713117.1 Fe-S cluster assembly ATPase SufC [Chloroflexota bacterium]MEE2620168.1 Fe-S cluster assembly ATPase SufC [Chloroflexota bacterium]